MKKEPSIEIPHRVFRPTFIIFRITEVTGATYSVFLVNQKPTNYQCVNNERLVIPFSLTANPLLYCLGITSPNITG